MNNLNLNELIIEYGQQIYRELSSKQLPHTLKNALLDIKAAASNELKNNGKKVSDENIGNKILEVLKNSVSSENALQFAAVMNHLMPKIKFSAPNWKEAKLKINEVGKLSKKNSERVSNRSLGIINALKVSFDTTRKKQIEIPEIMSTSPSSSKIPQHQDDKITDSLNSKRNSVSDAESISPLPHLLKENSVSYSISDFINEVDLPEIDLEDDQEIAEINLNFDRESLKDAIAQQSRIVAKNYYKPMFNEDLVIQVIKEASINALENENREITEKNIGNKILAVIKKEVTPENALQYAALMKKVISKIKFSEQNWLEAKGTVNNAGGLDKNFQDRVDNKNIGGYRKQISLAVKEVKAKFSEILEEKSSRASNKNGNRGR